MASTPTSMLRWFNSAESARLAKGQDSTGRCVFAKFPVGMMTGGASGTMAHLYRVAVDRRGGKTPSLSRLLMRTG